MYSMQTERECINGFWYYYLKASGKWHVFIHLTPHMVKIRENIDTLEEAKEIARKFSNLKEFKNEYVQDND